MDPGFGKRVLFAIDAERSQDWRPVQKLARREYSKTRMAKNWEHHILKALVNNAHTSVLFTWRDTPQGNDYWHKAYSGKIGNSWAYEAFYYLRMLG